MKKNYYFGFCLILSLFLAASSFAQNKNAIWTKTDKQRLSSKEKMIRKSEPTKADFYQLDLETLKSQLQSAPDRKTTSESNLIIDFPLADGTIESFKIFEASVMAKELQAKYPSIKSYSGTSINDSGNTIRFSVTPQGLHLMMFSINKGTQFIDPYTKQGNNYIVYAKRDLPVLDTKWECGFIDDPSMTNKELGNSYAARNTGGNMRDFRIAIATTIEYSQFHWQAAGLTAANTIAERKVPVMAAIVVTMTRNNFVYERDFSITMTLIANNDTIVFIDSDNFTNNDANSLIVESQIEIDAAIGSANYDVGHTFSTGGGGLATLNSPCNNSTKARGITGSGTPVGDPYDIDYVAHELGHQFGAPHTFNGNQGNCAGGNRTASNAYEPGSGTTIMAYAGICGSDNVQSNSDPYFHQKSLQMIWDNVSTGVSTCANQTATGNSSPTADAGSNYIIPMSTPYMLTGSSTDADGTTNHTYTWEQYDLGPSGIPADNTASGPLVRSFEGTTSPTRYIPRLADLVNFNGSTTWEKLSSVDRNINFRLTVRDNDNRGGRTAVDNMLVNVETTAGPFLVTSQNSSVTWSQGNLETITWDVAGTNAGTVNTPNVDILLSTDGGLTFPTVLATNVPNDGSHDVNVPNVTSDNCRVMVRGNGNIFFNINTARIAIGFNITTNCASFEDNTPKVLPTSATAYSNYPITVSGLTGQVSDVNVYADIDSNRTNETYLAVNGPGGAANYFSALYAANCAQNQRDIRVTFDDSAPAFACANPNVGTYAPTGDLTVINGAAPNDTWFFRAANVGTTTVTVNSFRFDICTQTITASPNRINQSVIQLIPSATEIVTNTHLEVTSSNTASTTDIVYTLTVLPTNGTLHLNAGGALVLGNTFTQDDINSNRVTYTNTSGVNGTDFFRVDTNDSNGGTLPNLRTDIIIDSALSTDGFNFDIFNVYPNPTTNTVNLILSTQDNVLVSLLDIRGRRVFVNEFNNSNNVFEKEIDISDISSGVYLLNVETGGKKATKKLIIN